MLKAILSHKIKFYLFSIFLLCTVTANAAPTLKDYGTLPSISMVAISPDGNSVAFRKVVDGKDLLVAISLKEKKQLMMLDIEKIQPIDIFFLNNDQVYLFVSEYKRVSGFRGKFDTSTGFVLDIKTQKFRQLLTPGEEKVYPGQTGLGEHQ